MFDLLRQALRATYQWGKAHPLYGQIGMLMELDNSPVISSLRAASAIGLRELIERDKERGLIKPEVRHFRRPMLSPWAEERDMKMAKQTVGRTALGAAICRLIEQS